MVRMNVNPSAYDQRLFCYFWNSASFRHQIESSARTTAGIYKINQALLMAYRFPLMPLAEQRVIVEILDSQIPALDSLESDIDANLQKAEALRQSILKKAFAGELVSQDPADEPAADLLARIRAERAAASSAKPVRTRGRPSASAPSA
jgi:type I restriction enzyme S subunit